jgi:hypothetical protein
MIAPVKNHTDIINTRQIGLQQRVMDFRVASPLGISIIFI